MQALVAALASFHSEVGPILKQSRAQYGQYADLATVLATVTQPLVNAGLVVSQTFTPWDGGYTILRTTLAHTSGESITSDVLMPLDANARNQLHAFGAACTYLRRYALLAILNLAAEDDDGDSFTKDTSRTAKAASPSKAPAKPPTPVAPVKAEPVGPAELTRDERAELLSVVSKLPADTRDSLVAAFRTQYALPEGVKVSDYIRNADHATFINSFCAPIA